MGAFTGWQWCHKCRRHVGNLDDHLSMSSWHNVCRCGADYDSYDDLLEHCRHTAFDECDYACEGCNDGTGGVVTTDWDVHARDYHVCDSCDQHHDSNSELRDHRHSYHRQPRHRRDPRYQEVECFRCDRTFGKAGSMMLHLESGTCPGDVTILDVNYQASIRSQWSRWISGPCRSVMLSRRHLGPDDCPYYCCECEIRFARLSALIQHLDGTTCNMTVYNGKIRKLFETFGSCI